MQAVESVLVQTLPAKEIIIVDDASVPPFEIHSQSAREANITLIRIQPNAGAAAARNVGARCASGTHLAFLDSDDVWSPAHLSTLVGEIELNRSNVAVYSWCRGRSPIPVGALKIRRICDRRMAWPPPSWRTSAFIVRREAFEYLGGFEESLRFREDTDLFLRVMEFGRVAAVRRRTATCRKQAGGLTRQGNRDLVRQRSDYLAVVARQIARNRDRGCAREVSAERLMTQFHFYWSLRWLLYLRPRRAFREVKALLGLARLSW